MWWQDYSHAPRRPANGIRATTQRGQFGKTWWAARWIAALERLVDAGRLSRGRSYARSGQVVKLDVGWDGIAARVQGSRPQPYGVSIHFRHLSDAEWDKVIDAMAAQAISALVGLGEATSPATFGISPAEAAQVGLTISNGVTPAFWIYCAFVIALIVLCGWMFMQRRQVAADAAPLATSPIS